MTDALGLATGFAYFAVGVVLAIVAIQLIWDGFLAIVTHLFF